MRDDFEATFVVDLPPDEAWEILSRRTIGGDTDGEVHYVLPGFPSFAQLPLEGASCTALEVDRGRLLRVRKDHHPCAGTEIAIWFEPQEKGTRVRVVQSGFESSFLNLVGRDSVFDHGRQIVRDLRLYLERGLTVPGTAWGPNFGARARQTPVGVELEAVEVGGVAETAGLRAGDFLIALRGIRLHDIQQLSTVLALTEAGTTVDVIWARGRKPMSGEAVF